jgi:hypothetical protein
VAEAVARAAEAETLPEAQALPEREAEALLEKEEEPVLLPLLQVRGL